MRSSSARTIAALTFANLLWTLLNFWLGRGSRRLGRALLDLQRAAADGEDIGVFCKRGPKTTTLTLEASSLVPPRNVALDFSRRLACLVQLREETCDLRCRAVGVTATSPSEWSGPTVQFDVEVSLEGRRLAPVNAAGGKHHITLFEVSSGLADEVAQELQELLAAELPFEVDLGRHCARQPLLTQTSRRARLPYAVHRLLLNAKAGKGLRWHRNNDHGRDLHVAL